ncbi:rhomboid family intramembrane serine protease [Amphibacillus xylanus]|uniref:Peptidase S54 family protein n=1 Tax=Amphibacillus xylanus (strain ATCC 51415 / DSM 6626 / JCM 7361 / LMG 17667 / NBRC 15112 / Ep01) TaxID=698758 RepID=K0J625_AMPXN|nr:rhomboid family intramembrane serine protease [Amphibacillus xylanus]BAM46473.1 peptidase S54 family protein [Amphibacillus xylanus NBRC 15112]
MFFRNESFRDFIRLYPVISGILAINIILWLLMYFPNPIGKLIWIWGVGWNTGIEIGEYWRLVTPIFLHAPNEVTHILFNSFSLILFGPALEQMIGKFKFIFVYLFTGIVGNVFTYFVGINDLHLGASGALYGLLGLFLFMSFFRQDLIDPASRQIVTIITLMGVLMTFIQPGINISAHIFGLIAGLALGPIVLTKAKHYSPNVVYRRRVVRSDGLNYDPNRWDRRRYRPNRNLSSIIWWVVIILAALGILFGII